MLLRGKVSRKVVQNLSFYTKKSQFLCFSGCAEPQNRTFYVQQISRMRIFAGVFKYDICIGKGGK